VSPGNRCTPVATNDEGQRTGIASPYDPRPKVEGTAEQAIGALIARDGAIADYLGPEIAQREARGPIPQLGTAEWEHLDDGDPRKVGAVFVAARDWATIDSIRRWTVLDEPRQAEAERLTAERMASIEVSQAEDWDAASRRRSYAELQRRRSVVVQ